MKPVTVVEKDFSSVAQRARANLTEGNEENEGRRLEMANNGFNYFADSAHADGLEKPATSIFVSFVCFCELELPFRLNR